MRRSDRVKPISVIEAIDAKKERERTPDFVIAAFNKLVAEHFDGNVAVFLQADLIEAIIDGWKVTRPDDLKTGDQQRESRMQIVTSTNWLNVEKLYRKAGWYVDHKVPRGPENFAATFTFTVMRREK